MQFLHSFIRLFVCFESPLYLVLAQPLLELLISPAPVQPLRPVQSRTPDRRTIADREEEGRAKTGDGGVSSVTRVA